MVSGCLPSDALSQHLPSYLGFSYLGRGVSLHGCSSKVQPLLLALDEGYLLMAAPPDLERGVANLSLPVPTQPPLGRVNLRCTKTTFGSSLSLLLFSNSYLKKKKKPTPKYELHPYSGLGTFACNNCLW